MKKIVLLCNLFTLFMGAYAQDIIVTKEAQKIEAKILEVSSTEIKYKKQSNLEGPTFILGVEEINSIIYANGEVQLLFTKQQKEQLVQSAQPASNATTPTQPIETKPITPTSKETTPIYYASQYKGQSLPVFTFQKVMVPYYQTPRYRYVADNMVFTEGEFLKFCKAHCYEAYKYKNDISTAFSVYNRTCAEKGNVDEEQNTNRDNPQQVDKNNREITNSFDKQSDNQRPFIKRAMFNMYIDAGMIVPKAVPKGFFLGASTNFTFGCRIKDYVFVGGSIGYDYFFTNLLHPYYSYIYNEEGELLLRERVPINSHAITAMANVRVYIPVKPNIYPYFETSVGTSSFIILNPISTSFRLKVGVGIDASRFSFGLGYDFSSKTSFDFVDHYEHHHIYNNYKTHSFYFKLGIRIGHMR